MPTFTPIEQASLRSRVGFTNLTLECFARVTAYRDRFLAGYAVLCAAAKQLGLESSLAIKNFVRQVLSLEKSKWIFLKDERTLSPLLCWIHVAPVCGAASRARNIQGRPSDPKVR